MARNSDKLGSVKAHSSKFSVIYSNDDPYVPQSEAELLKGNVNAKLILDPNRGHFSDDDGVTQLPSALKELLEIAK